MLVFGTLPRGGNRAYTWHLVFTLHDEMSEFAEEMIWIESLKSLCQSCVCLYMFTVILGDPVELSDCIRYLSNLAPVISHNEAY